MNPHVAYLLNLSIQQIQSNRLDDAERSLSQVIRVDPKNADAWCFLSVIAAQRHRLEEALDFILKSITYNPKNSIAYSNKGNILSELNNLEESRVAYERALLLDSKNYEAFNNLGNLEQKFSNYHQAIIYYDKAIKLDPVYAEAYSNKGNALTSLGNYEESLLMYSKAIELRPHYVDAWLNRSFTLNKLKRIEEAIASSDYAISINPENPLVWTSKALIFSMNGLHEQSINFYDRAISIDKACVEAWASRGSSLIELKRYKEALNSYESAFELDKNIDLLIGDIIHLKLLIGEWKDIDEYRAMLIKSLEKNKNALDPSKVNSVMDNPEIGLQAAVKRVKNKYPLRNVLPTFQKYNHKKIRVGYFSADFKVHPVSYLLAELFELHDRERFEIYAFSLKQTDPSDQMRLRLRSSFDRWLDVEEKTEIEVATIARECEIDIAVDLGGFTQYAPTEIMSCRAAPIQVNYFGYPGTMGAEYIDYIIADTTLIPPDSQKYYSEKIVYLPGTYMVDDSGRLPSNRSYERVDFGLPEGKFVFCCFNNGYKITEKLFKIWVKILKSTPDSVLWITENNKIFKENLTREVLQAGIEEDRIIFAQNIKEMPDHLARIRLADLFLDTYPYNAHSTAVDAIKAGIPILTCPGKSFASRVASSILNAANLPELIADSFEEYERIAVDFALNPDKIKTIKKKLQCNKELFSLVNNRIYVKNLEIAYATMNEIWMRGESTRNIFVDSSKELANPQP